MSRTAKRSDWPELRCAIASASACVHPCESSHEAQIAPQFLQRPYSAARDRKAVATPDVRRRNLEYLPVAFRSHEAPAQIRPGLSLSLHPGPFAHDCARSPRLRPRFQCRKIISLRRFTTADCTPSDCVEGM